MPSAAFCITDLHPTTPFLPHSPAQRPSHKLRQKPHKIPPLLSAAAHNFSLQPPQPNVRGATHISPTSTRPASIIPFPHPDLRPRPTTTTLTCTSSIHHYELEPRRCTPATNHRNHVHESATTSSTTPSIIHSPFQLQSTTATQKYYSPHLFTTNSEPSTSLRLCNPTSTQSHEPSANSLTFATVPTHHYKSEFHPSMWHTLARIHTARPSSYLH